MSDEKRETWDEAERRIQRGKRDRLNKFLANADVFQAHRSWRVGEISDDEFNEVQAREECVQRLGGRWEDHVCRGSKK